MNMNGMVNPCHCTPAFSLSQTHSTEHLDAGQSLPEVGADSLRWKGEWAGMGMLMPLHSVR